MQNLAIKLAGLVLVVACCAQSSCVNDDADEPVLPDKGSALMSFSITLPTMQSRANDYFPGVGYENYIDTSRDKFCILMFDADNKYLLKFTPLMLIPNGEGENTIEYTVVGNLPDALKEKQKPDGSYDFKIVVLANWTTYPELTAGTSTLSDLCDASEGQFKNLSEVDESGKWTSLALDPEKSLNLAGAGVSEQKCVIPFFGVHSYKDIIFKAGVRTTLPGEITLLRAMAKIEVIFDTPGLELSDVILHGYNSTGYCAPTLVASENDYAQNPEDWYASYDTKIHLPGSGNTNEANAENNTTHLFPTENADGKTVWVAYVPEYKNVGVETTKRANLELNLDIPDITIDGRVQFQRYEKNTADNMYKPIPDSDFDIQRNSIYRFNVSLANGGLIINVKKWENAYDNNFIFE